MVAVRSGLNAYLTLNVLGGADRDRPNVLTRAVTQDMLARAPISPV